MRSKATAYKVSDRANCGPLVHETEGMELATRGKDGHARPHWTLNEAAAYEAMALLELLAMWRRKR